ncbi:hypothetical protein [Terasakiella sp.]|uniref:hypothetical protein n=1 Tax=Terasakiella sp. TaxID=2034861 RepID=UPI003AA9A7E3
MVKKETGRQSFLPSHAFKGKDISVLQGLENLTFYDEAANRELLTYLCDNQGYFQNDPQFGSVYVWERELGTAFVRIDNLNWQMASDKRWTDFPRFLMRHIISKQGRKDRGRAERLAKELVYNAYLGKWSELMEIIKSAKEV